MKSHRTGFAAKRARKVLAVLIVAAGSRISAPAQSPAGAQSAPAAPAWAQPGSAAHTQVAPPADFHRPTTTFDTPIGIFEGQSDVGRAVVPGSASYDAATGRYTVNSAGYNVWYTRDEFRYLWKKMSGDVSLAADISFPDANGYGDRKAVLVIRQSLDDDAKEALVALHGAGMIQLARRPEKDERVKDMEYRIGGRGMPGGESPDALPLDRLLPPDAGVVDRLALRHEDRRPAPSPGPAEHGHRLGPPVADDPERVGTIALQGGAHRPRAGAASDGLQDATREKGDPFERLDTLGAIPGIETLGARRLVSDEAAAAALKVPG